MGRNSKRQQREDQELQLLSTSTPAIESDEEAKTSEIATNSGRQNLFNSFTTTLAAEAGEEDEEDEEQDEEEGDARLRTGQSQGGLKKKKPKKKKKKNKTTLDSPTETTLPSTRTAKNGQNNMNNKASSKTGKEKETEVDEIDQALQELSTKLKSIQPADHPQRTLDQQEAAINNLLKVDPKMLDPDLELRRMFGAKVVSSSGATIRPLHAVYGARITNDPHHQLNSKLKMKASLLAKPEPNWPPYSRASSGLSMRRMGAEEVAGRRLAEADLWFTFEHSMSFKLVQSRFLQAIMSLDPNQLMTILQRHPYHPDTLLQLSEVSAHNEDQGQATRFLNQALFVSEKTLWTASSSFFSSGTARLDFRLVQNRNLFKALDLKLKLLLKQGCYRSSFQTCKFLFSLNPYQDPFGALLWIDFLAPKASQDQFFLDFLDNLADLQNRDPNGGIYTEAYPGLYYSRALCLRAIEERERCSNHDPSDFALESAILRFPQVIKPLARATGHSIPVEYERIERAQVDEGYTEDAARSMLHLKARIYATRAASLWKVPETSAWLRRILERVVPKFSQPDDPDVQLGIQFASNPQLHLVAAEGIHRAVLVSDVQAFKNFLPPSVYSHSATAFSFDPLPPEGGTSYDAEYFRKTDEVAGESYGMDRTQQEEEEAEAEEEEMMGRMMGGEQEAEAALERLLAQADDPEQRNHLVNQIQFVLQLDNDLLQPHQRQALLARLDRLFEDPPCPSSDSSSTPGPGPQR
ncbi:hypothetical protein PTTG_08969 [Puccinia triticina 1-1 BBBD Race 1]|uniref:DUF654-domain-containing protein n=1 Tax=Puccinia triticina (isolate 1-1 / race 1 (BBBD)) TaxID=630390 RepID=A0A180G4R5_PUCT1|nr:hypothetical protein PTTG_08969 [Puccinia triticina 1-1 BBBD Race 1]